MGALDLTGWQKLPVGLKELCINTTLRCGQSFRWRKSDQGVWSMALHGRVLSLYQDPTHLYYKATLPTKKPNPTISDNDTLPLLTHYLNLTPNLTSLYEQWSTADANFKKRAPKFTGIRILKQDAWEALVGFICSSNNNIIRISQMVEKLCRNYGPFIAEIEGEEFYDFPVPSALAKDGVEQKLRELGFGYRAKYIARTACMIVEKGDGWLDGLRNPESPVLGVEPKDAGEWSAEGREGYRSAHEALLELQGVGPKVADCVCLMGLGWGEAVPVDTHVWQIAVKDYRFGKGKHSSLTKATYDAVGNKFRSLWGKEAGWAHSVLFTADLKAFSERLVDNVKIEDEIKTEIKSEIQGADELDITVHNDEVVIKGIKREADDTEDMPLVETKPNIVKPVNKRSKRRKAS